MYSYFNIEAILYFINHNNIPVDEFCKKCDLSITIFKNVIITNYADDETVDKIINGLFYYLERTTYLILK